MRKTITTCIIILFLIPIIQNCNNNDTNNGNINNKNIATENDKLRNIKANSLNKKTSIRIINGNNKINQSNSAKIPLCINPIDLKDTKQMGRVKRINNVPISRISRENFLLKNNKNVKKIDKPLNNIK